jgi:Flp pilus assembly protein TadG
MGSVDERHSRKRRTGRDGMRRFADDHRGNVAVIFALALIPVFFLTGMAFDFTRAAQKRVLLNAAADAAALAAVTPAMMAQSDAKAIQAAQNIFNAQASSIPALSYSANNLSVSVNDQGLTRTVTVSYTGASQNIFASVLNQATWSISGSSTASATVAPNIDFYLLLDNSPSMNIAATTAGINLMVANTSAQGGCAFACHESHPSADNLGNPGGEDNYTLAKNLGVVTRVENMASAAQQLTTVAAATEASSNASYRMAIYTFNGSGTSTVQTLTSNMTTAGTAAGNIDVLEVYDNNCLTSSNCNSDEDTDFNTAMSNINSVMPAPGTGAATSTPQEVLFIVSDGVDDKNSTTCSQPLTGSRCQQPFDTTWCTTVKNRGIRIAMLYTVYLPLPTNSWYNKWISPFQSQIATNMQSCASPGLYFSVTTDGDISTAMQQLFNQAVATAHLTQ